VVILSHNLSINDRRLSRTERCNLCFCKRYIYFISVFTNNSDNYLHLE